MRTIALFASIAACAGLAACDTRVTVEASANPSAQFSSVLVTVKEIWFNENQTAAPDDASWLKFPLAEPRALDLVNIDNTTVSEVASELDVQTGTYRQIRLFLVDRTEPLTESARRAGATFNDQVMFVDANGVEATLPLELSDAAHGIGIQTELVVAVPNRAILAALAAASERSAASTNARSALRGTALSGSGSTFGGSQGTTIGTAFTTVPGGTVPSTMVPGTTLPSTMVPGTTLPGTTVPGTTVPGTTVPGASASTPIVPGATRPGSTAPGTTPTMPIVPGTTTPGTTTTGTTTTSPSSTSGTAPNMNVRSMTVTSSIFFDAGRDLTAFRFSDRPGFLLNPSLTAHDLDEVGNIEGALDVSSVASGAGASRPDVEVTAEELNGDSNRRVKVASAPVRADGTFTLYPLPLKGGADGTAYDLVIHGPAVTTVVIRGVPVTEGAPGAGSNVALSAISLIGSDTFRANLATDRSVAPRSGRVQFYQTLADDDAPFIIAERPVDPLTGRLAADEPLSAAPAVVYGTFGPGFSLIAAAPREGTASYSVAASAPLYGNGDFSSTPLGPSTPPSRTAVFAVPEIAIRAPAAPGTIAANVTTATPGKYDNGALLVTHDGAVVTATPLSGALAGPQTSTVVGVANVPAGAASSFESGLYFLEAWAWSSADPEGSFTRQPVSAAVDLRGASAATVDVAVN